jgi:integrator complex subunit 5
MERDLCIRRAFDSTPLLWTLLKFMAVHRPALCYCSVLLRAITASLIAQWSSTSQGRSLLPDVQLVRTSVTLFEILALGQLLPTPLSGIRDIVQHLQPQHVSTQRNHL